MPEEVNRVLTDPASDMKRFDRSKKEEIVKMATVFNPKRKQKNVFGDGKASKRIVEIISGINMKNVYRKMKKNNDLLVHSLIISEVILCLE